MSNNTTETMANQQRYHERKKIAKKKVKCIMKKIKKDYKEIAHDQYRGLSGKQKEKKREKIDTKNCLKKTNKKGKHT